MSLATTAAAPARAAAIPTRPEPQEQMTMTFEPLPVAPACDLVDLAIPEMRPPKGEIIEMSDLPDIEVNVID